MDYIETRALQDRKLSCRALPKQAGYLYRPIRWEVKLTGAVKRARVDFCQTHVVQHPDWRQVIFTDEIRFELGVLRQWVWRRGNAYSPEVSGEKIAHPAKVMVWGGVRYGVESTLHIVARTDDIQ
jgi:hypothetical protein